MLPFRMFVAACTRPASAPPHLHALCVEIPPPCCPTACSDQTVLILSGRPGRDAIGGTATIPLSPLPATLIGAPASVANKRLTAQLNLLDATLTKNRGMGQCREIQMATSLLFYLFVSLSPHCSAKPLVQQFPKARDFFTIRGNNSAPPGV